MAPRLYSRRKLSDSIPTSGMKGSKMNVRLWFFLLAIVAVNDGSPVSAQEPTPMIRAGMIGLDTSHVPAFTRIFNSAKPGDDTAGIKVVVGYPGGTDIPASRDRVEKFTEQLRGLGVEIVKRQGGAPVSLADVLAKAQVEAATKLSAAAP